MNRNHLVLILVALFTISVIAVAASSINSANIESGFGIEGGSDELGNASPPNASSEKAGDAGGSGNSGFISEILSWELSVNSDSAASPNSGISGVIIVVLLGLVAGSIGLIFWATSDDTALSTTPESPVSEHTPDGTESGTGNSATVDLTNEVYRAWWEMVRQLDIPRSQSRSPAEFATAAIDAGMDPEKVTELTALFRSVRYGDKPITSEVEQRASDVSNQFQSHTSTANQEEAEP